MLVNDRKKKKFDSADYFMQKAQSDYSTSIDSIENLN